MDKSDIKYDSSIVKIMNLINLSHRYEKKEKIIIIAYIFYLFHVVVMKIKTTFLIMIDFVW